jgi:ankyrin repeat protein
LRSKKPLLQVSGNSVWSMVPPQLSRPLKEGSPAQRWLTSFEELSLEDNVSLMSIGSTEPLLQKTAAEKEPIVATINEKLDQKFPMCDPIRPRGSSHLLRDGQYDTWHLDLAVAQSRLDILEKILPIPTVKLDEWKKCQLANACRNGNEGLVRLLLENGADARAREAPGSFFMLGRTALHLAALQGNVEIAQLLIQCGASVNDIYTGYRTPLHEAASKGNSAIAMLLLQKGAPVDACDESRYRPLHAACMAGSYDVARVLLQRGANIHSVGNDFFHPIHHAAQDGGLPALIALLAANGADLEAQTPFRQRPLQLACKSQGASTVKALIQAGADPNAGVGDKPIQIACKSGAPEVVPVLLEAGADVDFGEGIGTGLELNTPLGRAVYRRHVPIITMLLKRGANTNACNATGFTVLHMVAMDHGIPSMHFNVRERTEEALHILLEHGADTNATDDGGRTVFHYLAKFLISTTVDAMHVRNLASQFRNAGADIDALNYDGDSPLDVAASSLKPGLVQIFVENGARGVRPRTFESLAAFEGLVRDEKSYDAGRIRRFLRHSNLAV